MTEPEPPGNFLRILAAFERHRVAYVLIGMGAGLLHGSTHLTQDLDFLIGGDLENRNRTALTLTELGARTLNGPGPDHDDLRHGNTLWNTRHGHVDILLNATGPDGTTFTYRALSPKAVPVTGIVPGHSIPIASLPDLIAMKRAAGRNKDLQVLPELEALRDAKTVDGQAPASRCPAPPRAPEPPPPTP